MQATNDTFRKQQNIRRKAENGIRAKYEARFFVELILAVVMMCFALVGIGRAIETSPLAHTGWVPVLILASFVLMAMGVWKYCDMRQRELLKQASDAVTEFRKAFGLEF